MIDSNWILCFSFLILDGSKYAAGKRQQQKQQQQRIDYMLPNLHMHKNGYGSKPPWLWFVCEFSNFF